MSAAVSGHVWLYEGRRSKTWCVKWRDHQGQHERRLGPAWAQKGPPAPGCFREREAKAALEEILVEARKGVSQQRRTGVTFARAAEDWYEHGMLERDWSPSPKAEYRSALVAHLIPAFSELRIEAIAPGRIERFRNDGVRQGRHLSPQRQPAARDHARDLHPRMRLPRAQGQPGGCGQEAGVSPTTRPDTSSSPPRRSSCSSTQPLLGLRPILHAVPSACGRVAYHSV